MELTVSGAIASAVNQQHSFYSSMLSQAAPLISGVVVDLLVVMIGVLALLVMLYGIEYFRHAFKQAQREAFEDAFVSGHNGDSSVSSSVVKESSSVVSFKDRGGDTWSDIGGRWRKSSGLSSTGKTRERDDIMDVWEESAADAKRFRSGSDTRGSYGEDFD